MNLETYESPEDLYLARGDEVNPNRPVFTGDVFRGVAIPGVQDQGMGIVVAHPCSFRIAEARLADRLFVARVGPIAKQGPGAWRSGYLDMMPLTDLDGKGYWAASLDEIGRAETTAVVSGERVACLSAFGINLLQQRLTCHLTRVEVPTFTFQGAFAHTFEEADLLEEWTDTLTGAGWTKPDAIAAFEIHIRAGSPSLQAKLRDPQLRSSVRRECRSEASRLATTDR